MLQVGDRTKTAEELEEAEAARLQALENRRQILMSGDDLGDDMPEPDELPAGGYARQRAKKRKQEQEAEKEGSGKALFEVQFSHHTGQYRLVY